MLTDNFLKLLIKSIHTLPFVFIYQLSYTTDSYHQFPFNYRHQNRKKYPQYNQLCCGRITTTITLCCHPVVCNGMWTACGIFLNFLTYSNNTFTIHRGTFPWVKILIMKFNSCEFANFLFANEIFQVFIINEFANMFIQIFSLCQ